MRLSQKVLALGCLLCLAAGPALAEGAVIKGGTVVIAPGAKVEGLANIRPGEDGKTIEIDCPGGGSFSLSAGDAPGSCSATTDADGAVESGRCDDGGANAAVAVCALDDGRGACSMTLGAGTCQPL